MTLFISTSEEETAQCAADLATRAHTGMIFALYGPIGAGKSTFCRAFIRSLAGTALDVPSPTFTLVQTYESPKGRISHFDLYRLNDPEDIFELGWDDALKEDIVLVEWPERAGPYLPKRAVPIELAYKNEKERLITIGDFIKMEEGKC